MNNDLKFELKLRQLGEAAERLEQFKAKGWTVMVESTEKLIKKLEAELDELEA